MTKKDSAAFAAISLLLIITALFFIPSQKHPGKKMPPVIVTSQELVFNDSLDLINYFDSIDYGWPIKSAAHIPKTLIKKMPQDMKDLKDVKTRKHLFIRIMLPIIIAEQKRIREQRKTLKLILQSDIQQNKKMQNWLNKLFKEYKIKPSLSFEEKANALLTKFDELPITLVLAQAAIESGWGTSRFTRLGNSLFGEWTFEPGDGIIPVNRQPGKTHEVKAFPSLRDAIASYIKNINRNNAYKELRKYRADMRKNHQPLDAKILAKGLQRYSQKGEAYVTSLLKILNSKEFKQVEALKLDAI